jgi:hypothetical protein
MMPLASWLPAALPHQAMVVLVGLMGLGVAALAIVGGRRLFSRAGPPAEVVPVTALPEPDPYLHGSPTEQRRAARRKGGVIHVLLSDQHAKAAPSSGYVVNRSLGGLCLAVKETAAPGTILTVRTVNAPEVTPWIELRVCSCRQTREGWELGCQFVRVPPTGLLLLFG